MAGERTTVLNYAPDMSAYGVAKNSRRTSPKQPIDAEHGSAMQYFSNKIINNTFANNAGMAEQTAYLSNADGYGRTS